MGKVVGFTEIREHEPGPITTKAKIVCTSCSKTISSVGGPVYNSYCLVCIRDRYDRIPVTEQEEEEWKRLTRSRPGND